MTSLRANRNVIILLAIITLIGGALRVYRIGDKGLWLDEAFSIWLARRPWTEMLSWVIQIDQHPPLYYTLLHLWLGFGDDAATVRMLSALFSTLTIPVIFALGHKVDGASTGLLAALLLAGSPFHIWLAQEARMYALLTFNASLALLTLSHLLFDLGTTPRKTALLCVAFASTTVAAMLTHNTAVFFPIAANALIAGWHVWRRWSENKTTPGARYAPPSLKNWALLQLGILVLWGVWLRPFVIQSRGVYAEFWLPAPTWGKIAETLKNFLSAFLPNDLGWGHMLWGLYVALFGLRIRAWRERPPVLLFLLAFLSLPFLGELAISLKRPIFYDRTLIWTTIPLYLILAAGIRQLRRRSWRVAILLVLAAINGLSARQYFVHFEKEQWEQAAIYVAQSAHKDDLVLFNATWVQIPFDYYFERIEERALGAPLARHGVPVDLFARGILEPKMSASDLPRLRALIKERERVWLIYSHQWYTDPERLIPLALERELVMRDRRDFRGVQVRLYGLPP